MDKKNRQVFLDTLLIVSLFLLVVVLVSLFIRERELLDLSVIYIFVIVALFEVIVLYKLRIKKQNSNELDKLSTLIEYNQRRKEIEQEIDKLTEQLMKSDVASYIDVNRLVFSGQNSFYHDKIVNYENFFEQFGIQKEKVEVKKNSAVFLTPFSKDGEWLYKCCQTILADMNVFLRRTDNLVNKDDILMNIISIIVESELVLVNIDGRNPNVYYELGIAHAIGKPTILLAKNKFAIEEVGFDIRQKRIILYDNGDDLEKQLLYQINRIRKN